MHAYLMRPSKDILAVVLAEFYPRQLHQTHRNKQIRHLALVLLPRLSIFRSALLNIPNGTMYDHAGEEQWIEPREGRVEAGDSAPGESEEEIAGVMDLARVAI